MRAELTPRKLLALADQHRGTAAAAEWARTKIRLGEEPIMSGGLLRFKKNPGDYRELTFTAAEVAAIYQALAKVRQDEEQLADSYEARVTTGGAS